MSNPVPNRSARGCLTCKQRKKKCDETKPVCERCLIGNFQCLGYSHPDSPMHPSSGRHYGAPQSLRTTILPLVVDSTLITQSTSSLTCAQDVPLERGNEICQWAEEQYLKAMPRSLEPDPRNIDNMLQLIVTQHCRFARRIMFRPFPFSIGNALARRAKSSSMLRWSMYLGARIMQALLDGTNWQGYIGWIDNFHRCISATQSPALEVDTVGLADRLKALQDLAFYAFMVLNSSAGYILFRKSTPIFLQLAAKFPEIWIDRSAISIYHALQAPKHEIIKFVLTDTIAALAFGVVPLLHYDTTVYELDEKLLRPWFLEYVYACPRIIIILLARINALRLSRLANQAAEIFNELEVRETEKHLRDWKPALDYLDQPSDLVARLAVQECWRQAVSIYLYMGMCGANSADERIVPLVKQVVQLASTVGAGNLEAHLFIPCLIAGVAARKEKHRAIIYKKVKASRKADACLLRGADFVFVLGHLWHGAAAGGAATTWEDYVNSRCAVLPVET